MALLSRSLAEAAASSSSSSSTRLPHNRRRHSHHRLSSHSNGGSGGHRLAFETENALRSRSALTAASAAGSVSTANGATARTRHQWSHALAKCMTSALAGQRSYHHKRYYPLVTRRRRSNSQAATLNTSADKLAKCRRMFSALQISSAPVNTKATKRGMMLRRQRSRKQRQIEYRRLQRALKSPPQASTTTATTTATATATSSGSRAAPSTTTATTFTSAVNGSALSAPIGIPGTSGRDMTALSMPDSSFGQSLSFSLSSFTSHYPASTAVAASAPFPSLPASPLDALLIAASLQNVHAGSGGEYDTRRHTTSLATVSAPTHNEEMDDDMFGMDMDIEPEYPATSAPPLPSTRLLHDPPTKQHTPLRSTLYPNSNTFTPALAATLLPPSSMPSAYAAPPFDMQSMHQRPRPTPALASSAPTTLHLPALEEESDEARLLADEHDVHPLEEDTDLSMPDSPGDTERIYTCEFISCGKRFTQIAHLRIHERAHTGDRPYVCPFDGCGRAFSQHGNLKTHERRHTGEKPFRCLYPNCGKAFSQQGNLRTHERIHLDLRPYQCPHSGCDRSFNQRGNLKTHQLKMHGWLLAPIVVEPPNVSARVSAIASLAAQEAARSPGGTVDQLVEAMMAAGLAKPSISPPPSTAVVAADEPPILPGSIDNAALADNAPRGAAIQGAPRGRALSVTNEEAQLLARMKCIAERRLSLTAVDLDQFK